jgi:hypothetical protein
MPVFRHVMHVISAGVIRIDFVETILILGRYPQNQSPSKFVSSGTKVTSQTTSAEKILQSNAESPPPAITTFDYDTLRVLNKIELLLCLHSFNAFQFPVSWPKLPKPPAIAIVVGA